MKVIGPLCFLWKEISLSHICNDHNTCCCYEFKNLAASFCHCFISLLELRHMVNKMFKSWHSGWGFFFFQLWLQVNNALKNIILNSLPKYECTLLFIKWTSHSIKYYMKSHHKLLARKLQNRQLSCNRYRNGNSLKTRIGKIEENFQFWKKSKLVHSHKILKYDNHNLFHIVWR